MGNVAVLGACVRLLAPHGLGFLEQAIAARMGALAEANVAAAREGYARCTRQHALAGDTPVEPAPDPDRPARRSPPVFAGQHDGLAVATTPARGRSTGR